MKGLALIKNAMKLEEVDRIPWVPFVGAHAGQLLQLTATDFLQSVENLIKGVNKAIELYNPDGIPVQIPPANKIKERIAAYLKGKNSLVS